MEIVVVLALVGILALFAVGAFRQWSAAAGQSGTSAEVSSALRQAQVRAISEGVSFCVSFDTVDSTYTVSRFACNTATVKVSGPTPMSDRRTHVTQARFLRPDGTTSTGVTFRPSGSAWPGSLVLTRDGATKTYTIHVEGFTGRVYVD